MIWAAMAAAGALTMADFAWMAGDWIEEAPGAVTRETWLPARDGTMAGVGQTARPGKPVRVEFMTITERPGGLAFTGIVDGQAPTVFVLRPGADGEAVFENLAHDFPHRVIYWRCDADLCGRIEGLRDGTPRRIDWRYRRVSEGR
jgi:hypothetical protein